jgi:hypothetical protein
MPPCLGLRGAIETPAISNPPGFSRSYVFPTVQHFAMLRNRVMFFVGPNRRTSARRTLIPHV